MKRKRSISPTTSSNPSQGMEMEQSPPTEISPPLLRIPIEIREIIYCHLLTGNDVLTQSSYSVQPAGDRSILHQAPILLLSGPKSLGLLFTCRLIFDELLPYTASHLDHTLGLVWYPHKFQMRLLSKAYLNNIKSLKILVPETDLSRNCVFSVLQELSTLKRLVLNGIDLSRSDIFGPRSKGFCLASKESHDYLRRLCNKSNSEFVMSAFTTFFRHALVQVDKALPNPKGVRIELQVQLFNGCYDEGEVEDQDSWSWNDADDEDIHCEDLVSELAQIERVTN